MFLNGSGIVDREGKHEGRSFSLACHVTVERLVQACRSRIRQNGGIVSLASHTGSTIASA
jgi:hypothetical protein